MINIRNKPLIIACLSILLISGIGCASKSTTSAAPTQTVTVQRGNLAITASVDGNLVMPNAYNLTFGAAGEVQYVIGDDDPTGQKPAEGRYVTAGTILASLDDSSQRLQFELDNNAVQQALSSLYETVPLLPKFPEHNYDAVVVTTPATSVTVPGTPITTLGTPITTPTVLTPPSTPLGTTTVITPGTPVITTTTTTPTPGTTVITTTTTTPTTTVTTVTTAGVTPGTTETTATIQVDTTTTLATTTTTQAKTTSTLTDMGIANGEVTNTLNGTSNERDWNVAYPFYYPNSTTLTSFAWAQQEVSRAQALLQSGKYVEATSQLYIAQGDLEACISIIEDAINNPNSGLGTAAQFSGQEEAESWLQQYDTFGTSFIGVLQNLAEQIKQTQAALEKLRTSITQGNYTEADSAFKDVAPQMDGINLTLTDNVNRIEKRDDTTVYGRDISFHLYDAAEAKLNAAQAGIEKGGLNSSDLNSNLRIAQHYIQLCNAILGSNELSLPHGLSLQNTNNYNIALAQKLASLDVDENNLLHTVIFAPFDGTVVSVGVKDKDVLSEQDRSSRTAVTLVDTKTIQFQGLVDEIDILKINTGDNATISVDAVPDKKFTGHVSFISDSGTADTSGVVKFNVTIQLDPTDVDLKGDLSATADITVSTVENVLLVPLSAITTTNSGSFVTVTNGAKGQSGKRQVTLGKQNQQFAEVVSGLEEGDKVVITEKMTGAPVITRPQFGGGGGGPPPGR